KQKLKQVDFRFDGRDFRALEQNPNTKSRRAAMARKHQKVMQFLEGGTETEPKASTRQQMIRPPKCRNPETEREKRPMRSSLGDEIEPGCDAFNPQTSNLSASLAVLSHQYSLSERQHLQPRIWYHEPNYSRTSQQNSKRYSGRIFWHIQHYVVSLPARRAFYGSVFHVIECNRGLFFVHSHPQSRPSQNFF